MQRRGKARLSKPVFRPHQTISPPPQPPLPPRIPLSVQRFDWKCKSGETLTNHADGEREQRPQAVLFSVFLLQPCCINSAVRFSGKQTFNATARQISRESRIKKKRKTTEGKSSAAERLCYEMESS